jgi:hypothetical protein
MGEATPTRTPDAQLRAALAAQEIEVDDADLAVLRAIRRLQEPLKAELAADLCDVALERAPDYGREPR